MQLYLYFITLVADCYLFETIYFCWKIYLNDSIENNFFQKFFFLNVVLPLSPPVMGHLSDRLLWSIFWIIITHILHITNHAGPSVWAAIHFCLLFRTLFTLTYHWFICYQHLLYMSLSEWDYFSVPSFPVWWQLGRLHPTTESTCKITPTHPGHRNLIY